MSRISPGKAGLSFFLLVILVLAPGLVQAPFSLAASGPPPQKSAGTPNSFRILDERTAFRWDPEFFAWAVHYPEKIVPLWVQEKKPPTKKAAEELRRSYRSTLRLDDSTTVLFSVFAYTQKPVQLKPISRHLFLRRTADGDAGRKIPPKKADLVFDQPVAGLKQGLVFFPKTPEPFELVLEIPGKPPIVFTFQEDRLKASQDSLSEKSKREQREAVEKERKKWETQVARLQQELAKLKEAAGSKPGTMATSVIPPGPVPPGETDKAKPQPELVARRFFEAWKSGDLALMQTFLSDSLQKQFPSKEALAAFLRKKALPERLPGDAALEAVKDVKVFRITLTTKVLLLRDVRRFVFTVEDTEKGGFAISKME